MDATYWNKQDPLQPLYPEIEWSKPETKVHAKSMVIIGGNAHGFMQVAKAYETALQAGIGSVKVLLPETALKSFTLTLPVTVETAAANSSGGFSRKAVPQLLAFAHAADGVLLAGEFGRNSETAITIQELLHAYSGPIIASKDVINYFITDPAEITKRENTILVLNFAQLQKLAQAIAFERPLLFEDNLSTLVENLHLLTTSYPFTIITLHHSTLLVAHKGRVSTTLNKGSDPNELWQLTTASYASVYALQHPTKLFEALTTAIISEGE